MDSRSVPNFCSQCGASLAPDDAFCSQCGSSVGDGGSGATGKTEFRRRVEDLTVEGWEVEHDYGDRVVLIDRGFGSWGVHAFLLLFTGGLGNIPYAWYNYSVGADRLEVKSDGTHRYISDSGREESSDSTARTAGNVAASFFCALIGLSILGGGVSSIPAFFVAVTFLMLALYAFPPVRERLHERRSVTTFGSVRSTDEEIVSAPDVPCTACSSPVETGVKRTFHETFYFAGFPVSRDEEGTNHYCQSCAQGDPFTSGGVDAEREDDDLDTEFEF